MIAAIEKAQSLAHFAAHSGCPLSSFALVLTETEAYELLDYLADGGMGRYENHALLIADIARAKRTGEPWGVLACFQLEGLDIWPASALH